MEFTRDKNYDYKDDPDQGRDLILLLFVSAAACLLVGTAIGMGLSAYLNPCQ